MNKKIIYRNKKVSVVQFYVINVGKKKLIGCMDKYGLTLGSVDKGSACNAGDTGSIPGSGKIPWRRAWQPTPVFLPGEFHGQRSLAGYSP